MTLRYKCEANVLDKEIDEFDVSGAITLARRGKITSVDEQPFLLLKITKRNKRLGVVTSEETVHAKMIRNRYGGSIVHKKTRYTYEHFHQFRNGKEEYTSKSVSKVRETKLGKGHRATIRKIHFLGT